MSIIKMLRNISRVKREIFGLWKGTTRRIGFSYMTPVEKPVMSLAVNAIVELSA